MASLKVVRWGYNLRVANNSSWIAIIDLAGSGRFEDLSSKIAPQMQLYYSYIGCVHILVRLVLQF